MEMKFNLFNANKLTINIVLEHNNKLINYSDEFN